MIDKATRRIQYLESVKALLQPAIDSAPDGTIKLKTKNDKVYFYLALNGHDLYLDITKIPIYATKRFHIYAARAVEAEIKALKAYLDRMPDTRFEDVMGQMPDALKPHIHPAVMTREQYAKWWQEQPFKPKAFNKNDTSSFYTKKGERVRSKSELIIANMLYDLGIPYKYEMPMILSGGKHLVHPDFSLLKVSNSEECYLEHLGMMDDKGYIEDFAFKYNIYQANGIFLGQKLFFTCESDKTPLDTKLLEEFLIKTFK